MKFKLGDLVTRSSHNNDIVFKIVKIEEELVFLKGVDLRLFADSHISDLVKAKYSYNESDRDIIATNVLNVKLDRSQYFYLPGRILHIDADHLCNSEFEKVL